MTALLYSTSLTPVDPARTCVSPLPIPFATWRGEPLLTSVVVSTGEDVEVVPAPDFKTVLSAWHGEAERSGRSFAVTGSHRELVGALDALFDRWGPPVGLSTRLRDASGLVRLDLRVVDGRPVSRYAPPDAETSLAAATADVWLVFGVADIGPFTRHIAGPPELSTLPELLTRCAALVTVHRALAEPVLQVDVADPSVSAVANALRTIAEPARLEDWYAERWRVETQPRRSTVIDAKILHLRGEGTLDHLACAAADTVEIVGPSGRHWIDVEALQRLPNLRSLTARHGVVWSLDGLDQVEHLCLPTPPLAADASLSRLRRLRRLELDFATPAELAELSAAPALTSLVVYGTTEPDAALSAIATIATLQALVLDRLPPNIDPLADLPALRRLRVLGASSAPVDLRPLTERHTLRHLALPHASILSLAPLVDVPLESLELCGLDLDLSALAELPRLRHVCLRLATLPAELARRLVAVEALELEGIDDVDPSIFAEMPALRRLDLRGVTLAGALPLLPHVQVVHDAHRRR